MECDQSGEACDAVSAVLDDHSALRVHERLNYDAIFRYRLTDPPALEYVSPSIERYFGYTADQLYCDPGLWFQLLREHFPRAWANGGVGDALAAQPERFAMVEEVVAENVSGTPLVVEGRLRAVSASGDAKVASGADDGRAALLDHTTDVLLVVGPDLCIRYASPSAESLFGYSAEECVGQSAVAFVHPDDMSQVAGLFDSFSTNGIASHHPEFRVRHANGEWREVLAMGTHRIEHPIRIGVEDTVLRGIVVSVRDITETRRIEARSVELAALLASSIDAVVFADRDLCVTTWSDAATTLFGPSEMRAIGRPLYELLGEDIRVELNDLREHVLTDGRQTRYLQPDLEGSRPGAWVTASPVRDRFGDVVGFAFVLREAVAYAREVEALVHSEEQFDRVFMHSAIGQGIMSPEGEILSVNDALCRALQYEPKELIGRSVDYFCDPDDAATTARAAAPLLNGASDEALFEKRYLRRDGQVVHMLVALSAIRDADGSAAYLLALMNDITSRKEAENALRASEERYRSVLDVLSEGVVVMDRKGHVVNANAAAERLLGAEALNPELALTLPERIPTRHEDGTFFRPDECPGWRVLTTGLPVRDLVMGLQLGDTERWLLVDAAPLCAPGESEPYGVVTSCRDVTDQRIALATLAASEEQFREVLDSLSEVVFQTDADGVIQLMNRAWESLSGISVADTLGHVGIEFVHPDDVESVREQYARADAADPNQGEVRYRMLGPDGEVRNVETRYRTTRDAEGTATGMLGTAVDYSDREALEGELRHAQKLEAVGRLAAGIAHEINTPIQFVGDNVHFLQEAFEELTSLLTAYRGELHNDEARPWNERQERLVAIEAGIDFDYLEAEVPAAAGQALEGVQRVATIVSAMKAFGHPDHGDWRVADLNEALSNTLIVARNEYKYVATAETDFGELPLVPCVVSDIDQVFLNIIVNAAHAIGPTNEGEDRGVITVRTRHDEEHNQAVISFTDTGTGIAPEHQANIFDPFFTTKEVGRGTGQGLALARTIVMDRHHGSLTFESVLGEGTTFTIRLPLETERAND
ncbi:MAG: domain S-box protein [Actinomycetia bacterium]|nr:domain S-box protein [Actinomycetes bacterium]